MTTEQEANMWARLVRLEEQIDQVIDVMIKMSRQREVPENLPAEVHMPEPPRDHYGAYGRPEEG